MSSGDRSGFGRISPADNAFDIVADTALPQVTKGIFVGTAGNLRVRMAGGAEVTFNNLAAGIVHPIRVIFVFSGATTATDIIGLV